MTALQGLALERCPALSLLVLTGLATLKLGDERRGARAGVWKGHTAIGNAVIG